MPSGPLHGERARGRTYRSPGIDCQSGAPRWALSGGCHRGSRWASGGGAIIEERIAERLRTWHAAGLIDHATAAAIAGFEAADTRPGPTLPGDGDRLVVSDILAYLGVAVVLAGILYALFAGVGGTAIGPSILGLAGVAGGLAWGFLRGASSAGRRAAGAALAVAAALAAMGLGLILASAGAFANTTTRPGFDPSGQPGGTAERNVAAIAAIAAAVAMVLGVAGLEAIPSALLALLVGAAAHVLAFTATEALGGGVWQRSGLAPLVAGSALALLSRHSRLRAAAGPLLFSAAIVPAPALLIIGATDGAPTWALLGVATAVTAIVLRGALVDRSNALAVAGVVGAFGIAVDVTARTLGDSGGASVVLIVSGLLLVGCAILTQRVIRRNREAAAT